MLEGPVVVHIAEVEPGGGAVPVDELGPRGEAAVHRRWRRALLAEFLAGFSPVVQQVANVGENITERAELPVEHGLHRAPVRVDEGVAKAIVAVHDAGVVLFGLGRGEPFERSIHRGKLAGLRLLPLPLPPAELTVEVGLFAAEVAEADGVGVCGMKRGEDVDQVVAEVGSGGVIRHLEIGDVGVVEDDPFDVSHHVERGAVHRLVLAEAECFGHRHVRLADTGDDPMLAAHVMRCGQYCAERWPTKHSLCAVAIRHLVGEVRVATLDELEAVRTGQGRDVGVEPHRNARLIDSGDRSVYPKVHTQS